LFYIYKDLLKISRTYFKLVCYKLKQSFFYSQT